jgi:hypothetical protein
MNTATMNTFENQWSTTDCLLSLGLTVKIFHGCQKSLLNAIDNLMQISKPEVKINLLLPLKTCADPVAMVQKVIDSI